MDARRQTDPRRAERGNLMATMLPADPRRFGDTADVLPPAARKRW